MLSKLKYDEKGLIPVITQDYLSKEVLMLAYMNEETLKLTIEKKQAVYFSRSRQEIWHKGLTSGHFQNVKSLKYDCDKDAILLEVEQIGNACHEGDKSCFHYDLLSFSQDGQDTRALSEINSLGERLENLRNTISERKETMPEGSYCTYLFTKGIDKILKKVGEECAEVIIAAKNPDKSELIYETCDLLFHLNVLLEERGVSLDELNKELLNREK